MLKFFRRIRQRLLSENKFSKYLLYAIGEIILVVIGILIALQINNANENKKQEQTEFSYLKRLIIDLNKDKTLWKDVYESRKNKVYYIQSLIALNFNNQQDTLNYIELGNNMKTAMTWEDINPNQDTFTEMLSSGNLDIVKNDSIKIKLITLNNNYASITNWDKTSENTHQRIMEATSRHYNTADFAPLSDKFSKYTSVKFTKQDTIAAFNALKISVTNFISDKLTLNNLDILSDNYDRQLSVFKSLENDTEALINLIKTEIQGRIND